MILGKIIRLQHGVSGQWYNIDKERSSVFTNSSNYVEGAGNGRGQAFYGQLKSWSAEATLLIASASDIATLFSLLGAEASPWRFVCGETAYSGKAYLSSFSLEANKRSLVIIRIVLIGTGKLNESEI